ncbi:asparaginase [Pontivivens ytuae]|uniref:Asparaginase n=1 Tax=Pontivivens ytuae TaxID=2789856 RepID=A0A7S9QEQ3_9RHOB|nr:asparaginase [Pontivivens ytuae]QPH55431.1 asparaginase [Pontivivens ytuae]
MTDRSPAAAELVEVWRGGLLESVHRGHAVVVHSGGDVLAEWGTADATVFPRSSCKMLQALPLIESGAAEAAGLGDAHLALACASHQGALIHTERVGAWLGDLGLGEGDLRCGPQFPNDKAERDRLLNSGERACQIHNNCSGKHAGFLTLSKHLGGGAEYNEIDHPVQRAVKAAHEEMADETSPGHGIDGCSAPNHASSLRGLAYAMARMADPGGLGEARQNAARRLVSAMKAHPLLVAGEGRACSEMMAAMPGPTVIKTGAEAVFIAILPELGLGVALKIEDGTTRASECAIAAILARLGVADPAHPLIAKRLNPPQKNRRGLVTGEIRPAPGLWADGAALS